MLGTAAAWVGYLPSLGLSPHPSPPAVASSALYDSSPLVNAQRQYPASVPSQWAGMAQQQQQAAMSGLVGSSPAGPLAAAAGPDWSHRPSMELPQSVASGASSSSSPDESYGGGSNPSLLFQAAAAANGASGPSRRAVSGSSDPACVAEQSLTNPLPCCPGCRSLLGDHAALSAMDHGPGQVSAWHF